jgi:hypothetical protein
VPSLLVAREVALPRTTPKDGDIVVCQETCEGAVRYVLHTAPGPDKCVLATSGEATAHAVALAEQYGVFMRGSRLMTVTPSCACEDFKY